MSLGGDCSEEIEGVGEREYSPYTLTYHPKGEVHAHRRGPVPPTGFGIVLLDKMAERAALFAPMAEVPQELRGEPFMRIAHQMVNEVRNADSSSTLALEALTLELIVCSSRARFTHEARRPRWLTQACELIESDYETDIKIAEIAATVGVHPAHLAAQFKQHLRCTPGQFIRGLRVQKSQPLLEQTALSVAVIAVTCGFYDEAHFCRTFKAVVGCTPTEFRRR
jgi:AraC family transcriptional regulator